MTSILVSNRIMAAIAAILNHVLRPVHTHEARQWLRMLSQARKSGLNVEEKTNQHPDKTLTDRNVHQRPAKAIH